MSVFDYVEVIMHIGLAAICILIITVTYGQMRQHGVIDLFGEGFWYVKRFFIKLNYLCGINMGFANFSVVLFLVAALDYIYVKRDYSYLLNEAKDPIALLYMFETTMVPVGTLKVLKMIVLFVEQVAPLLIFVRPSFQSNIIEGSN
jgi:hypothetical protein